MRGIFLATLAAAALALATASPTARGGDAEPVVRVQPDGSLVLGEVTARLMAYDAKWKVRSPSAGTLDAVWNDGALDARFQATPDHAFRLSQTAADGDGGDRYEYRLEAGGPVPLNLLALVFFLPADAPGGAVRLDEQTVAFPEAGRGGSLARRAAKAVAFRAGGADVVLRGNFAVEVRDQRRDGKGAVQLRLLLAPEGKAVERATLAFTLAWPGTMPAAPGQFTYPDDAAYQPLEPLPSLAVVPGSALDFSFLQDAPAGKHGRVVVSGGHFAFADRPGEPVRLYGANLCHDVNFPDREGADRLAAELARIGYNAVRLHHFDGLLTKDTAASTTLDPGKLDRLDYLFAACKRAGLYLAIDLYSTRALRPGDIPELPADLSRRALKHAVLLYDSARNNWKAYARALLGHVNPHTGLRWADDPALAMASLLNEDPAFHRWDAQPAMKAEFERQFAARRAEQGLPPVDPAKDKPAMARFLVERQVEVYAEFRRFLREELRTPLLSGGVNFKNAEAQSFIRETLDYVDNHSYFNHPHFQPGKSYAMPVTFHPGNPARGGFGTIRDLAQSRLFGKPFTITETNFVYPNPHRAAGGVILGAFGGLQDYDAIFRFAYSHHARKLFQVVPISYYDVAGDPVNLLAERAATILFLRRDVKPFPERRVWLYDESAYQAFRDFGKEGGRFPFDFGWLANVARIGSLNRDQLDGFDRKKAEFFVPRRARPLGGAAAWDGAEAKRIRESGRVATVDGEWSADFRSGSFELVTPRSEAFYLAEGGTAEGRFLRSAAREGGGLVFATSLDGAPLSEAKRLLLLHLTDVQNSGIRFDDEACTTLRNWGKLPLRLRRGVAEVDLRLPDGATVTALSPTGASGRTIAPVAGAKDGFRRYQLDTEANGQAMAYEITR